MKAFSKQSRSPKTAILLAFLLLIFVVPLTGFGSQRQRELRQQAAGNTIYASPGDNLSAKANSLSPGRTLLLQDGLNSNSELNVTGIHGTTPALVTLQRAH